MKFLSYRPIGTYCFLEDEEKRDVPSGDFYQTFGAALSDMIIFSVLLLIKHYPEMFKEYNYFLDASQWRKLTPHKAVAIFDNAFQEKLITSQGKYYESAFDAWGNYPERITAEIPGTKKYFDISIKKKSDYRVYEKRCEDCLWLKTYRNMPWCMNVNKACKNVSECPECIW